MVQNFDEVISSYSIYSFFRYTKIQKGMVSFITFPKKWKIDLIIYDAFLSITAFTASQLYFKRL